MHDIASGQRKAKGQLFYTGFEGLSGRRRAKTKTQRSFFRRLQTAKATHGRHSYGNTQRPMFEQTIDPLKSPTKEETRLFFATICTRFWTCLRTNIRHTKISQETRDASILRSLCTILWDDYSSLHLALAFDDSHCSRRVYVWSKTHETALFFAIFGTLFGRLASLAKTPDSGLCDTRNSAKKQETPPHFATFGTRFGWLAALAKIRVFGQRIEPLKPQMKQETLLFVATFWTLL